MRESSTTVCVCSEASLRCLEGAKHGAATEMDDSVALNFSENGVRHHTTLLEVLSLVWSD